MRRRTLLAVGAGTASASLSLAGCLSSGDNGSERTETPTATPADTPPDTPSDGNRRYEECSREVVPYGQLPDDVQDEVDAALEGRYEADRVYLREAMDVEESYVSVDDEYYDPHVTVEGDSEVLELRHVDPKALPDPRPVSVDNERDGARTVTVELVADDGTVLLEETREVRAGEVQFGSTRRAGTHEIRITVADGDEIEDEFTGSVRIDESHFSVIVVVEPDGIGISGAVAELGVCRYGE